MMESNVFHTSMDNPSCNLESKPALIYGLPSTFSIVGNTDVPNSPSIGPVILSPYLNHSPSNKGSLLSSPAKSIINPETCEMPNGAGNNNSRIDTSNKNDELTDVPLSSVANTVFEMSDISHQLTLLSPRATHKPMVQENQQVRKFDDSVPRISVRDLESNDLFKVSGFPRVSMPAVEDGLSSGSDLGTPSSSKLYPKNELNITAHSPSGSPDSVLGYAMKNQFGLAQSPSLDSFINPSLIKAISQDIKDIKRTLYSRDFPPVNNNNVISNHQSQTTATKTNHPENIPCCSEPSQMNASPLKSHANYKIPTNRMADQFSEPSKRDNCSTRPKLTVEAVVEQNNESNYSEKSRTAPAPHSPDVSRQFRLTRDDDDDSSEDLEAHQWTFPTQSHTVYSTSDDEDDCKNLDKRFETAQARNKIIQDKIIKTSVNSTMINDSSRSINRASGSGTRNGRSSSDSNPKNNRIHDSRPLSSDCPTKSASNRLGANPDHDFDSDEDTDQLLYKQYQSDKPVYIPELKKDSYIKSDYRVREVCLRHPSQPDSPIPGLMFRARYLGSTQINAERQSTRMSRMLQAQEVVNRIKAPEGESQPSVSVELFVSTDRIIILNTNLQDILIDHPLRSVSYIADIGELFVLMSRRPNPSTPPAPTENLVSDDQTEDSNSDKHDSSNSERSSSVTDSESSTGCKPSSQYGNKRQPIPKLLCHVLESSEAQLIAQAVGHAFHLAYVDFLRENGVKDLASVKHLDYEEVSKQQEIFCDELALFSDKERHKEVTIPKQRGEPLGVVIVESGWGSLLPTALLANMNPTGPAARCGQLNIGNQIMAVNGQSLVGLSLSAAQQIIKSCRNHTMVKLLIVDCPPVVEVLIRRPSLSYQLGFSVQDGVICSLLRGGIAERGGIRVDHRIIEINGHSVVAVPHEQIVHMLATAAGEIHIRTMPTSVFRLLTGQVTPRYI